MRYTTYGKYVPGMAEEVNLQGLLDQLSDFLLQSGFAGGEQSSSRDRTRISRGTGDDEHWLAPGWMRAISVRIRDASNAMSAV